MSTLKKICILEYESMDYVHKLLNVWKKVNTTSDQHLTIEVALESELFSSFDWSTLLSIITPREVCINRNSSCKKRMISITFPRKKIAVIFFFIYFSKFA